MWSNRKQRKKYSFLFLYYQWLREMHFFRMTASPTRINRQILTDIGKQNLSNSSGCGKFPLVIRKKCQNKPSSASGGRKQNSLLFKHFDWQLSTLNFEPKRSSCPSEIGRNIRAFCSMDIFRAHYLSKISWCVFVVDLALVKVILKYFFCHVLFVLFPV